MSASNRSSFSQMERTSRISLSDRFELLRREVQKRPILEYGIPKSTTPSLATQNNYNETVSRIDRPSAILQQGSERNKRLVLQMAGAPSVLAEINHQIYEPQIRAQIPQLTPINLPIIKKQQQFAQVKGIRQRLGNGTFANKTNGINTKANVKSRLGIKRKPIRQRIGVSSIQSGFKFNEISRVSNNNNIRSTRTNVTFKRKLQVNKFNPVKNFPNRRAANRPIQINRSRNITRPNIKPTVAANPANNRTRKPVTIEQLNQDLDVYMQNTRGSLNADLDAYMARA